MNRFIVVEGNKKTLGSYWLSHPQRRQFEGIGFYPKGAPKGYYNLWNGFAVEPREGDCSLFLEHIRENIANSDEAVYNYIIAWCAHMIQKPDELVGTAIVMRGLMGTGKGVFANGIGSLLGQHYIVANNSAHLVGKFNGHLKGKVLLHADEAFWGGDKQAEGTLKSMVTEPLLTIEEKGVNAYTIKNNIHMIFSTNNDWAVPAGAQERRFFVIDVGDKHMQDRPYFKKIQDQLDNGGREALLHYLMNYDLSSIDVGVFPKTNALLETKILSMSPIQKFLYAVLSKGNLKPYGTGWDDGIIAKEDLYKTYVQYAQDMKFKHMATQQEFGIQILKMFPKGTIATDAKIKDPSSSNLSKRKNVYKFPSLEECRKHFSKYLNQEIAWDNE
jgi:phage/plasmid-associated DNA primase